MSHASEIRTVSTPSKSLQSPALFLGLECLFLQCIRFPKSRVNNEPQLFFMPTWVRSCYKDIKCEKLQFKSSRTAALWKLWWDLAILYREWWFLWQMHWYLRLRLCCTSVAQVVSDSLMVVLFVDLWLWNWRRRVWFQAFRGPRLLARKGQRRVTPGAKSPTLSSGKV